MSDSNTSEEELDTEEEAAVRRLESEAPAPMTEEDAEMASIREVAFPSFDDVTDPTGAQRARPDVVTLKPRELKKGDSFEPTRPMAVLVHDLADPGRLNWETPQVLAQYPGRPDILANRPAATMANAAYWQRLKNMAMGEPYQCTMERPSIKEELERPPLLPTVGARDVRAELVGSDLDIGTLVEPTFRTSESSKGRQRLANFGLLERHEGFYRVESERENFASMDGRALIRQRVDALSPGALDGVGLALTADCEIHRVEYSAIPLIWPVFGWAYDFTTSWAYPHDMQSMEGLLLWELAKWHLACKAVFGQHIGIKERLLMLYGVSPIYLSWRAAVAVNVPGTSLEAKIVDWRRVLAACPVDVKERMPHEHGLGWTLKSVRARHAGQLASAPEWLVGQTAQDRYDLIDLWARHMPVNPSDETVVMRLEKIGDERLMLNKHEWFVSVLEAAADRGTTGRRHEADRCMLLADDRSNFRQTHFVLLDIVRKDKRIAPIVREASHRDYGNKSRCVTSRYNRQWMLRLKNANHHHPYPALEATNPEDHRSNLLIKAVSTTPEPVAESAIFLGQLEASATTENKKFDQMMADIAEQLDQAGQQTSNPPSKAVLHTVEEELKHADNGAEQMLRHAAEAPRALGGIRLPHKGCKGGSRQRQDPMAPPVQALQDWARVSTGDEALARDLATARRGRMTPLTGCDGPVSEGPVVVVEGFLYTENLYKAEHRMGIDVVTLNENGKAAMTPGTGHKTTAVAMEWGMRRKICAPWTEATLTMNKTSVKELFVDVGMGPGILSASLVMFDGRTRDPSRRHRREAWLYVASTNGRVLRIHRDNFGRSELRPYFDASVQKKGQEVTIIVDDLEVFAAQWKEVFGRRYPLMTSSLFDATMLMRHALFNAEGDAPLLTPLTWTAAEIFTRKGRYFALDRYPNVLYEGAAIGCNKDKAPIHGDESARSWVVSHLVVAQLDMSLLVAGTHLIKTGNKRSGASASDMAYTQGKLHIHGMLIFGGSGPTGAGIAVTAAERMDAKAMNAVTKVVGSFCRRLDDMKAFYSVTCMKKTLKVIWEEIGHLADSWHAGEVAMGLEPTPGDELTGLRGYGIQRALLGTYDEGNREMLLDALELLTGPDAITLDQVYDGSYLRATGETASALRRRTLQAIRQAENRVTPLHMLVRDIAMVGVTQEDVRRIPNHVNVKLEAPVTLLNYMAGHIDMSWSELPEVRMATGSASLPRVMGESIEARKAYESACTARFDRYRTPMCDTWDRVPQMPTKMVDFMRTAVSGEHGDDINNNPSESQEAEKDKIIESKHPVWTWPMDTAFGVTLRPAVGKTVAAWTYMAYIGQEIARTADPPTPIAIYASPGQAVVGLRQPLTGPEVDLMAEIVYAREAAMEAYKDGESGLLTGLKIDSARNQNEMRLHRIQALRVYAWQVVTTPAHLRVWLPTDASPLMLFSKRHEKDLKAALNSMGLPEDDFDIDENMEDEAKWAAIESAMLKWSDKIVTQACAAVHRYGDSTSWWTNKIMAAPRTPIVGTRLLVGVLSPPARDMNDLMITETPESLMGMARSHDSAATLAAGLDLLSEEASAVLRHARHITSCMETVLYRVARTSMAVTSNLDRNSPMVNWTTPVGATVEGALMAAQESLFAFGVHDKTVNAIVNMAKQQVAPTGLVKDRRATMGCTNAHVADIVAAALGSTSVPTEATMETTAAIMMRLAGRNADNATMVAAWARTISRACTDKAEQLMAGEMKHRLIFAAGGLNARTARMVDTSTTTTAHTLEMNSATEEAWAQLAPSSRHNIASEDGYTEKNEHGTLVSRLTSVHRATIPLLLDAPGQTDVFLREDLVKINDAAWATIWALPLQRMARTAAYNRKAEDATVLAAVELALASSGIGIAIPREYKTLTIPAAIARRRFYGVQALPGANGPRRPVAPALWPPSMGCVASQNFPRNWAMAVEMEWESTTRRDQEISSAIKDYINSRKPIRFDGDDVPVRMEALMATAYYPERAIAPITPVSAAAKQLGDSKDTFDAIKAFKRARMTTTLMGRVERGKRNRPMRATDDPTRANASRKTDAKPEHKERWQRSSVTMEPALRFPPSKPLTYAMVAAPQEDDTTRVTLAPATGQTDSRVRMTADAAFIEWRNDETTTWQSSSAGYLEWRMFTAEQARRLEAKQVEKQLKKSNDDRRPAANDEEWANENITHTTPKTFSKNREHGQGTSRQDTAPEAQSSPTPRRPMEQRIGRTPYKRDVSNRRDHSRPMEQRLGRSPYRQAESREHGNDDRAFKHRHNTRANSNGEREWFRTPDPRHQQRYGHSSRTPSRSSSRMAGRIGWRNYSRSPIRTPSGREDSHDGRRRDRPRGASGGSPPRPKRSKTLTADARRTVDNGQWSPSEVDRSHRDSYDYPVDRPKARTAKEAEAERIRKDNMKKPPPRPDNSKKSEAASTSKAPPPPPPRPTKPVGPTSWSQLDERAQELMKEKPKKEKRKEKREARTADHRDLSASIPQTSAPKDDKVKKVLQFSKEVETHTISATESDDSDSIKTPSMGSPDHTSNWSMDQMDTEVIDVPMAQALPSSSSSSEQPSAAAVDEDSKAKDNKETAEKKKGSKKKGDKPNDSNTPRRAHG